MRLALTGRRILRGVLLPGMVAVTLLPGPSGAQVSPHRIEVATFTCGEVLSLGGEARDRVLIYFNGYLDGKGGTTVWVAQVVGARVDRALAYCKATPTLPLLDAFSRAWKP
jgi:hypothetical protein